MALLPRQCHSSLTLPRPAVDNSWRALTGLSSTQLSQSDPSITTNEGPALVGYLAQLRTPTNPAGLRALFDSPAWDGIYAMFLTPLPKVGNYPKWICTELMTNISAQYGVNISLQDISRIFAVIYTQTDTEYRRKPSHEARTAVKALFPTPLEAARMRFISTVRGQ